jgi:hypothetical protein
VATVGGGVLPGSDLSASVKADFGAAFPIRTTWTTTVTAAVAQCVAPATTSASRIGRASLAALLGSMTSQIGQLAAQPGAPELKQAVLASLDNLQTQLNAPFLSVLAAGFASAQTGVSNATAVNMGSALGTLDSQFCALRDALNSAYNGAFRVTIRKSVCDPAGVQRPKRRDRLAMPRSGCPENVRMAGCKPHRIRRLTR